MKRALVATTLLLFSGHLLLCSCEESPAQRASVHDAGNDAGLPPPLLDGAVIPDANASDAAADAATDAQVEACDALPIPSDCPATTGNALPEELRCTGLYTDFAARQVACGVHAYAPAYALWSDDADKQRYLWLPPGTQIDVSNPDAFVFPEGTRLWKEFRIVDGDHKRLGETRLIVKRKEFWSATTYVWSPDGKTAIQTNTGVANLDGTGHTVPTRDQCRQCHVGRADFVLGFDPILLGPGASGLTMRAMHEQDLLTVGSAGSAAVPSGLLQAVAPGDAVEQAALGYLHVNCGISCHSQEPFAEGRMNGLDLRLEHGEYAEVPSTDAFRSAINQAYDAKAQLPTPVPPGGYLRVRPTDATRSLVLARMKVRGPEQMPRIGTNVVDALGVMAVEAWIEQMTPERGYPAPLP